LVREENGAAQRAAWGDVRLAAAVDKYGAAAEEDRVVQVLERQDQEHALLPVVEAV
jgi:hypothetical protein